MSFHGIFSEKGKMTPFNQPSHQFLSKKIQTYTWLAEQMILLCKQPDDKLTSCWDQKGVFQGFWKKFLESKLWVVFLQLISLFVLPSIVMFTEKFMTWFVNAYQFTLFTKYSVKALYEFLNMGVKDFQG